MPYKETKSHRIIFSKLKFLFTILMLGSITLISLIILFNLEPYDKIRGNPYMLLGFLRIMSFFWYSVISVVHFNAKHSKILNVLNAIRESDEVLPIKRNALKRLKIFMGVQLAFAIIGTITYNVLVSAGKIGRYRFLPVIGVVIVVPEIAHTYFLSFALAIGFYLDSINRQLSNLGNDNKISAKKYKTIYT